MKVKAKKKVYYGNQRYKEGQTIVLKDKKHFSEASMVNLEANTVDKKVKPDVKASKEEVKK